MRKFYKYLIPSVIASVFISMYCIIDGIFIGQRIGDVGLSAINIAWPITAFIQAIGMALGISGGILISTLEGKGEKEKATKLKGTVLLMVFVLSIILGGLLYMGSYNILRLFGASGDALEYGYEYIKIILMGSSFQMLGVALIPLLKNCGKVRYAMFASISTIFVNLILDYLLIYVFNMGLKGAAIASVVAQATAFIIAMIVYLKELKGIILNPNAFGAIALGAIAPFILNFSYSVLIIITNKLCLDYGANEAVAAYTLLSYMLYVVSATAQGVGDAIQPLFSFNEGARKFKENKVMLFKCFAIATALTFILSLVFYVFRNEFSRLFNLSEIATSMYNTGIIYYAIGFVILGIAKVTSSYFYSINNKLLANVLTIAEPIILTPICYLIFSPSKVNGIWISYLVVQVLLLIMSILSLYFTKKRVIGYKALLFDFDETLVDFYSCEEEIVKNTIRYYGFKYDDLVYNQYKIDNDIVWKEFEKNGDPNKTLFRQRWKNIFAKYKREIPENIDEIFDGYLIKTANLFPNTLEILESLANRYDIFIITNGPSIMQRERIKLSGVLPFVKDVFISEEVGYQKPNENFFKYVIEKTGYKNTELCVIGDSISSDIIGAKNSNIDAIWVSRTDEEYEGLRVNSVVELLELL